MGTENYVNHYVETLTSTMQDAILKNVSLQANIKLANEAIKELEDEISELRKSIDERDLDDSERIVQLESTLASLNEEVQLLRAIKVEYDNNKHQIDHVNTYRNALEKSREETNKVREQYENTIKELKDQIEYLKLTPAKRKKIEEAKAQPEPFTETDSVIEDGGSF